MIEPVTDAEVRAFRNCFHDRLDEIQDRDIRAAFEAASRVRTESASPEPAAIEIANKCAANECDCGEPAANEALVADARAEAERRFSKPPGARIVPGSPQHRDCLIFMDGVEFAADRICTQAQELERLRANTMAAVSDWRAAAKTHGETYHAHVDSEYVHDAAQSCFGKSVAFNAAANRLERILTGGD